MSVIEKYCSASCGREGPENPTRISKFGTWICDVCREQSTLKHRSMTALDNARIALNKADLAECLPECVPVLVISAFANYKEAEAALAYLVANAKAEIEHESVKAALTLVGDGLLSVVFDIMDYSL